jgi:hypothetical protein
MSLVKYSYPITTSHELGYKKIEDFLIPEGDYRACLDAYHKVPNAPSHSCVRCDLNWSNGFPHYHNQSATIHADYKKLVELLGKPVKIPKSIFKDQRKYNKIFYNRDTCVALATYPELSDVMWLGYLDDRKYKGRTAKDHFLIRDLGVGKNAYDYYHGYGDQEQAELNQNQLDSLFSGYIAPVLKSGLAEIKKAWKSIDEKYNFPEPDNLKLPDIKSWSISCYRKDGDPKRRSAIEIAEVLKQFIEE